MPYHQCPVCNLPMVSPNGPTNSGILLVGFKPGREEINRGVPFVGKSGDVLRYELGRVGIQYERCRSANLWVHGESKKEACYNYSLQQLMVELKTPRSGVLFMGSEFAPLFTGYKLMDICGIPFPTIDRLQINIPCVYIPSPVGVMTGPLGEFRLGIEKFKRMIGESNGSR